jgi:hypothetical protein
MWHDFSIEELSLNDVEGMRGKVNIKNVVRLHE